WTDVQGRIFLRLSPGDLLRQCIVLGQCRRVLQSGRSPSVGRAKALKFDEIGYWSEVKLDIIREYAKAYSTILAAQPRLSHIYIDAFAGAGVHVSKASGGEVAGSPLIAVNTEPPFREYHLIDLDGSKVQHLRSLLGARADIRIYQGDCNRIMLDQVL